MRFPEELWTDEQEREIARSLTAAFEDHPVILTDRLTNAVYLTRAAEELLGDRGEALVNRLTPSLLGFGGQGELPQGMTEALLGEGKPWRGVVKVGESEAGVQARLAEASAARAGSRFVCGIVRISREPLEAK